MILLPFLEAVPHTLEHFVRTTWYAHQPRSRSWPESLGRLVPQLMPYAVGVSGHGRLMDGFIEPSAYAGALLFPFAVTGVFARIRCRWFFLATGLFGLAVWAKTVVADAVAKLPLFDIALNERLLLWTLVSLCVLAALGANRIADGEGAPAFLAGCVAHARPRGLVRRPISSRGWPNWECRRVLPPRAHAGADHSPRSRAAPGRAPLATPPRDRRSDGPRPRLRGFARLRAGRRHIRRWPPSTFYPRFDVLEAIPADPAYRMAGVGRALIPNASAVYGLDDVRGYEAMTLRRFHETYPLWCVPQPVWFNRVDDPKRPFLSFLAARWILTEAGTEAPAGWPVRAEGAGLRLSRTPAPCRAPSRRQFTRSEPDAGRRLALLGAVNDFGERGVLEDGPASEWTSERDGGGRRSSSSTAAGWRSTCAPKRRRSSRRRLRRGPAGRPTVDGAPARDDPLQPRVSRGARPGRGAPR